jgi:hypothetical protein
MQKFSSKTLKIYEPASEHSDLISGQGSRRLCSVFLVYISGEASQIIRGLTASADALLVCQARLRLIERKAIYRIFPSQLSENLLIRRYIKTIWNGSKHLLRRCKENFKPTMSCFVFRKKSCRP